jgi:bifunctional non-homologous end joining protein LigD
MPIFDFCLPTNATTTVPSTPDWFHEVKYDGYRLRLERGRPRAPDQQRRLRLDQALSLDHRGRAQGQAEAVRARRRGRHPRHRWRQRLRRHSGKHDDEVQLCAFDILVDGDDALRKLPLHLRKTSLERLLARRPEGLFINPFERGEIGPDLFRAACDMGLEGLVSIRVALTRNNSATIHWDNVLYENLPKLADEYSGLSRHPAWPVPK